MPSILIDTGAIRALLDPGDKYHGQAVALFKSLGPADDLLTTWPVITECSFAIERNRVALWQWIHDSGIEVVDFSIQDLPAMLRLIAPYSDRLVESPRCARTGGPTDPARVTVVSSDNVVYPRSSAAQERTPPRLSRWRRP